MIAGGLGGDWLLSSARTPDGEAYGGTLTVEADDDAWDCRWHTNLPGRPKMRGVGILDADRFVASRTVDAKRTGESSPSPGVVIYRPTGEGTLPARWYHPDCQPAACRDDFPATTPPTMRRVRRSPSKHLHRLSPESRTRILSSGCWEHGPSTMA